MDPNDLGSSSPAVTATSAEHSSHHRTQHAQSDCGHYDSPHLKSSHSLLRNFSLRSRNTLSLRKVHCPPPPPLASRPANVRDHSASPSMDSSSSDANSSSSVWKKWRVKCVPNSNTLSARDGDLNVVPPYRDTVSCPQRSARKRSFFLPFLNVSRLVAPFQIPSSSSSSSSSDDSHCVIIPQSPPIQSNLDAIQDEDDNNVYGDSSYIGNPDEIVGSIRQIGCVDESQTQMQMDLKTGFELVPDTASPLLTPSSPISLPPSPISTNSSISPPLPSPLSSPSPNMNSDLNLKPSISQKRRAKFTLGDESDMDHDSSLAVAKAGSTDTEPVVLPNHSAQTTAPIPMHRPPLTRHKIFERESRDQVGASSTSAPSTRTSTTNARSIRRWTLSSALTNEDISDEGLVKELERMRKILEWDCLDGHDTSSLFPSASPPLTPCSPWLITQRALLTTRELILTERHYLSSLLLLLCPGSTLTPVPEMMTSHVKALVGVSERLLRGMEGEPSVRGVAEVFVEVGGSPGADGAENAFVGWCGVVGGWFQGDLADTPHVDIKRKRKKTSSGAPGEEHPLTISEHEGSGPGLVSTTTGEQAHTSPLMRNVSTWRKSMPSITGLGESGVWRKDKDKDRDKDEGDSAYGRGRMSPTFDVVPSSLMKSTSISKPIRKPAVRDLAILPTQRVMRYVLLYRDLLANTPPSSSSYPIVERAVEAACRIAEKCDQAQGNAAFVAGGFSSSGGSSSGSSTSMLNNNNNSSSGSRRFNGKRVMTMPEPNSKLKSGWSSTTQSSSATMTASSSESPTKSHFSLSSSAVSTSPSSLSSKPSSLPLPTSSTSKKNRLIVTNSLPPPLPSPPPSSFNSKIPITRSGRSFGSLSTSSTASSTTITTTTTTSGSTFSSSASSSPPSPFSSLSTPPPPLCLPKSTSSSNVSSRIPKPLSAV